MWNINCSQCDKPQAKWEFTNPESRLVGVSTFVCSSCFLYESVWGKSRRAVIDEYISDIEKANTEEAKRRCTASESGSLVSFYFRKDDSGRLLDAKDADTVLGFITLVSRQLQMRQRFASPVGTK
jgi:hypothetical protein